MIQLRPFQQKLKHDFHQAWDSGAKNVMIVSATGSGKTVVLADALLEERGSSIAMAHRRELVSQISLALARNGVRHRIVGSTKGSSLIRIISALHVSELGHSFIDPNARCGVGGVDTIVNMTDDWFKQVKLKVQDEAHHVLANNKWGRADLLFPNARGLYPTATPCRADGRGLGRHADGLMDALVLAPNMRDIINMGYLTDYRIFAPPSDFNRNNIELSDSTGDFKPQSAAKEVKRSSITGDIVQHYLRLAKGKLGVTFAVDVEAATEIAAEFRRAGVPAEVVTAKTPDMVRADILRRFALREILQIVNVDLFGEGFDLPAIEVVSFARPTESWNLFVQQFGRTLRLMLDSLIGFDNLTDDGRKRLIANSSKTIGIIIDHVANTLRHGLPDAYREYSLDRRERKSSKKSDAIPIRTCVNAQCMTVYERVYKACPYCHTVAPIAERSSPEYVDGDLLELDPSVLAALRGEIARIDGDFIAPHGLAWPAQAHARKVWQDRQEAQGSLRNAIAWFAGLEASRGIPEGESYRRFWFIFGVDVATAQTLGRKEAEELTANINKELIKFNIDGTVNAEVYFADDKR